MTLVMFFGGAWGYLRLLKLPVPPGQASSLPAGGGSLLSDSTVLLALSLLVFSAVLAGVLAVVPWFSPLATGLPGLLLLAWTALYLVSVRQAVALIPLRSHAFGAGWEALLGNGILGAAGAVLVFPLFIPSRWRLARRAASGELTRDVDDYLTAGPAEGEPRRERAERQPEDRAERQLEDEELVGTVLYRPAGTRPVDTTRVTGASRVLRKTGSFSMATGAQPQATATGAMPRATGSVPRATGAMPRGRGWQRRPATGLFQQQPHHDE
jgi:hypothetical protein